MSTIIKLTNPSRSVQGVAFNLEDMAACGDQYLDGVRAQAAQIIANANKEAETIRRRAEDEGRQAALRAAEKLLDEKVAKKMELVLPAMRQAVEAIQHAKQDWLNHWQQSAVHTAAAIAERVIRRQLPQMPDVPVNLVSEALQLAAGSSDLRIHLHPGDYETLAGQMPRLIEEFARVAKADVVADKTITPGGCRIETRHGTIDQQFEAQIARIEEELG